MTRRGCYNLSRSTGDSPCLTTALFLFGLLYRRWWLLLGDLAEPLIETLLTVVRSNGAGRLFELFNLSLFAMSESTPPYSYVAYIDEAGDPGLQRIKPLDPENGSSEWLILSAIVIGEPNERNVAPWRNTILRETKSQRKDLHFTHLKPWNKRIACTELAKLPARYFVVCSNKKNMRGYKNPFAETYPAPNWFYAWLSRLLLERVTYFVRQKSLEQYREIRKVCLEFSSRGGLDRFGLTSYFNWLKIRSAEGNNFLPLGNLVWETMDENLIFIFKNKQRAGLQLADTVASAFFKACDYVDTGECDPEFAKLLAPRMCHDPDGSPGPASGYSVKLMPKIGDAKLLPVQAEIFTFYGYPKQWWAPGSFTNSLSS
ncbi:DUF3800 domain-containing protein [Bradyrhizobium quebecense]|uniref:DUF3800 domain-containing protein n=2 Tax=Bradyrhizobium quebecense TaxID=2748629 RepID=A0ACD3VI87_9BRAD|nr:DUF3800 domain-containing protein [Bradyrhizobium quebecense]UGY06145.1 DUF3800 domain-containing protein [Bradyrhizobium quebecense]